MESEWNVIMKNGNVTQMHKRLTNPNCKGRPAPDLEIEEQMFIDAISLFRVMAELLCELLNGREGLDGEARGRDLLEESSDRGRTLREKKHLLIGRTVVQHGEEELQEGSHTLFVYNKKEIQYTCSLLQVLHVLQFKSQSLVFIQIL
jgi:hypothetical protein